MDLWHRLWNVAVTWAPQLLQISVRFLRNFCLAISISCADRITSALYFDRHEDALSDLVRRMGQRQRIVHTHPLMIMVLLLEQYGTNLQTFRNELDRQLVQLERRLGLNSLFHAPTATSDPTKLEQLNKDVHTCNMGMIVLELKMNFELELARFSRETLDKFEQCCKDSGGRSTDAQSLAQISDQIGCLTNRSDLNKAQLQSLLKRIQAQISALFSLIAQRDNSTNIALASESRKLAEAATRDSRVMRTIAVMNLVFLPSTLISVCIFP